MVQPSNARFMRFCNNLQARVRHYAWTAFAGFIALMNDRLLPQNRPLDARAIADWCSAFLAARDAGQHQYRGLPVDPEFAAAMDQPGNLQEFTYRGIKVGVNVNPKPRYLLGKGSSVPFVPTYQLQLRKWILQHQMTDRDLVAAPPRPTR